MSDDGPTTPRGIDAAQPSPPSQTSPPPQPDVAVRVVTTVGETTRRVDIALGATPAGGGTDEAGKTGSEPMSTAVEDGMVATFPTRRLWAFVRDFLPALDVVRAAPRGLPAPAPRPPGPTFTEDCRAHVAVAVISGAQVSVRAWLATDHELWEVDPVRGPQPAAPGALADLLVWDVTGAFGGASRPTGPAQPERNAS